MNLRLLSLGAALAVSSLFFVACGGDDDDDSGSNSNGDATSTANEDDKTDGEKSPTATGGGGGEVSGSGADDLRKLAENFGKKDYLITYEFDSEADSITGEMTMGQKGDKTYMRLKDGESDLIIIDDGKDSYLCSKDGSEKGTCLKTASTGEATPFSLEDIFDELDTDVKVTKQKDQTVAGRSAQCFLVEQEGSEDGTMCFDKKDGVLLSTELKGDEAFTLKATKVNTSPSDNDFKPPYEVQSLTGN